MKVNIELNSKMKWLPIIATTLMMVFGSCNKDDPDVTINPPSTERGYLVSYSKTGSMTAAEVQAAGREEGDISAYTRHDLDIYSIVYNSLDGGTPLEVSGLVLIPQGVSGALPIAQNHHGTIIPGDDGAVPSTYRGGMRGSSEMYFVGATMASNGYVVSMPDYVGYGATAMREHPYTIHHELAEVSVDMLRATKQLMQTLSMEFSNEVFLTGWSEGGGAGLATHKYLQEKYSDEFNVKASSLFAGPYDYFTFVKDIMAKRNEADDELSIYSWAMYATNNYNSSLNRATNDIWSYAVNDQNDALDIPSLKPADIFQAGFMDKLENETDMEWVTALKANSLLEGWIPSGHLFFHSGTLDFIVPHYNSVNAHEHFQRAGANSRLYEYPGEDHYTPLYKYVTTTLDDFSNLQ